MALCCQDQDPLPVQLGTCILRWTCCQHVYAVSLPWCRSAKADAGVKAMCWSERSLYEYNLSKHALSIAFPQNHVT
eukprot:4757507-Amphidinium_carterae.1